MNTYILKKDLPEANAGTRLYLFGDMFYYRTKTGDKVFLSEKEVKNNTEFYRPLTAMEFRFGCFQVNQ